MVESDDCIFYVEENGEVELVALIFPVKVNVEVVLSLQIMGDGVMLFKDGHEVLRMLFVDIFYSKVFNPKCEADWASAVCPETRGKYTFPISFRVCLIFLLFWCYHYGLGKFIHFLPNFEVDIAVFGDPLP